MKILVTGSAGHLGEAIVRTLQESNHDVVSLDILSSNFTSHVGTIADRQFVRNCMKGVGAVIHTATLHKPHVGTHSKKDFVDTNITGTLNLLEEALAVGVGSFVFTSTTSVFGDALIPSIGEPAAWITEEVVPVPKNIYGVTKMAAEDLCALFYRNHQLPCLVLRTSRFFPEEDDRKEVRHEYEDGNAKANEFLYRRVELEDVVTAHLAALSKAPVLGWGKYIISATTPFTQADLSELRTQAPAVLRRRVPEYEAEYIRRGWKMFPVIDRVYVNDKARAELGWNPRWDFRGVLYHLIKNESPVSALTKLVGSKGYHDQAFAEGPYPLEGV